MSFGPFDEALIKRSRQKWEYRGDTRPSFAEIPGPGQESVWDYPRPPRLEPTPKALRVEYQGHTIAETTAGYRILETASAGTYYFPPTDVVDGALRPSGARSVCEWKGEAETLDVIAPGGTVIGRAAWRYPDAWTPFETVAGYVAFLPSLLDCFVEGERVAAQPGGFYGGWVTGDLVGPIKGGPGTGHW